MENPIKMDDLGVPLFLETPIYPQQPGALFSLLNSSHETPGPCLSPNRSLPTIERHKSGPVSDLRSRYFYYANPSKVAIFERRYLLETIIWGIYHTVDG